MQALQQADALHAAQEEAEAVSADRVQQTCRGACALRALELLKSPQDPIIRDEREQALWTAAHRPGWSATRAEPALRREDDGSSAAAACFAPAPSTRTRHPPHRPQLRCTWRARRA